MINADGGTGGGAFRIIYGDFLKESSAVIKIKELNDCGNKFLQLGQLWDTVGLALMNLYNTGKNAIIDRLSDMIITIADQEEIELMRIQNILKDV